MNLDFVSSSGNPPSRITTLFKAIARSMAETEFQMKARKWFWSHQMQKNQPESYM